MSPQNIFVATVGICLVNGLVSPMLGVVWMLHPVWMPEMVPLTNETVFYGASLLVSTTTLLLSAVPAAIAERLGLTLEHAMWVWLAGAGLLLLLGLG
ncbi:hypothetical protein DFH01_03365 [Falsiroseomonas bella]|uniref:Uncharacterized protein n=1 Tax=Falsiroseomonas bella TaxID=2184016 RepID=A0A317FJ38_9PROT|nr:hypothetical protein [Falsiroseomonas bella]PWS38342.1 hypothetical protein DFH01_03365 [Falsiroseomonas bella]